MADRGDHGARDLRGAYILTKQRLRVAARGAATSCRWSSRQSTPCARDSAPRSPSPGVKVGQIDGVEAARRARRVRASIDPEKLPAHLRRRDRCAGAQHAAQGHAGPACRPGDPSGAAAAKGGDGQRGPDLLAGGRRPAAARARHGHADVGAGPDQRTSESGLKGRGRDLNSVLRSVGPTAAQTRRITDCSRPAGTRSRSSCTTSDHHARGGARATAELSQVVDAGDATFAALASERRARWSEALALLPGTLDAARGTLQRTVPFARAPRRSATAFTPALARLRSTLRGTPDATRGLVPLPAERAAPVHRRRGAAGAERAARASRDLTAPRRAADSRRSRAGRDTTNSWPTRRPASRATCSGWPGSRTTPTRCSPRRTPTARCGAARADTRCASLAALRR